MNSQMNKMNKLMRESILEVVKRCAEKYDFSYESAVEFLEEKEGFKYPIPYSVKVEGLCSGVAVNHGLYTQCQKVMVLDSELCVGCKKQSDTNTSGEPDNGLIKNRDVEDWKSPSGKSVSSYLSVLRKMKLDVSKVKEEASKYNITIDEKHFEEERKTKERGRPKNPEKEVEVNATENLFQELVQSQMSAVSPAKEKNSEKKENKLMGAEEKEQKAVAKEVAKEVAKAVAKEQKDLAKEQAIKDKELAKEQVIKEFIKEVEVIKEVKELAKEQKELAKEQALKDKELAKEQALKEKELAKEQEKKNKEMAKEQALKEKELAKEQAKKDKPAKKTKKSSGSDSDSESSVKSSAKSVSTVASAAPVEDAPIKVRKLQHKGTTYLHDAKSGAIYDLLSNDHIGQWNESKKDIDFAEEVELEEEEEEDSDDEEKEQPGSDAEDDDA